MRVCSHIRIKSVAYEGLELHQCLDCPHKWRTDHNPLEDTCSESAVKLVMDRAKTLQLLRSNTTPSASDSKTEEPLSAVTASSDQSRPVQTVGALVTEHALGDTTLIKRVTEEPCPHCRNGNAAPVDDDGIPYGELMYA